MYHIYIYYTYIIYIYNVWWSLWLATALLNFILWKIGWLVRPRGHFAELSPLEDAVSCATGRQDLCHGGRSTQLPRWQYLLWGTPTLALVMGDGHPPAQPSALDKTLRAGICGDHMNRIKVRSVGKYRNDLICKTNFKLQTINKVRS